MSHNFAAMASALVGGTKVSVKGRIAVYSFPLHCKGIACRSLGAKHDSFNLEEWIASQESCAFLLKL